MLIDQTVGIKEAIRLGILDSDLSTYKDLHTGKTYTIQQAIDEGFLLAVLEESNKPNGDITGKLLIIDCVLLQVIYCVYCVPAYCALCTMYCASCTVHHVLCIMYCAPCTVHCAL